LPDYILAADIGTSGCRTVLFDSGLRPISAVTGEYQTQFAAGGRAEQDPEQWLAQFAGTTRESLRRAEIDPGDVAVVGIDAISSTPVCLDGDGSVLAPSPIWLDRRATRQSLALASRAGAELERIGGNRSDPSNFGTKLIWFRDEQPDLYERTSVFLHPCGYLVRQLTGILCMDRSECGLSQLCDIRNGDWSDELIGLAGLDAAKLPPVVACHEVVGRVTRQAAEATGLAAGTPVVAGCMDNVAATLATGVCQPGRACVSAGTATNANLCHDGSSFPPLALNYHHVVPGLYIAAGAVDYGGAGLRWFRDVLGKPDYQEIDRSVEEHPFDHEPLIFLPYMVGQRAPMWNEDTRGVVFGMGPDTSRTALLRALMEGNALGTRRVLEILAQGRSEAWPLRFTGGCANSRIWTQIFADATGRAMEVAGERDAAPTGAAINAAVGVGLLESHAQGAAGVKVSRTVTPLAERRDHYERLYEVFLLLFDRVQDPYRALAALTCGEERYA
jgi:sugar (pentulose or hexulose) kinase